MQTKDDMIAALQTPQKAPFTVTFEIFASTARRDIAKWPKQLAELMSRPAMEFLQKNQKRMYSAEAAEAEKAKSIKSIKKHIITVHEDTLLNRLEKHEARYQRVKEYFNKKIIELGLSKPLVFFDDKALRIDIGYGPKEILALFPDFFDYRGVFDETILGGVSLFGKSPLKYFLDDFIEDDYNQFLGAEKQRILASTSTDFPKFLTPKGNISIKETSDFKEAELIERCFETNKGLIIGEVHEHKSPKQFLIDNMALFKSQGVTMLYMEHLLQERHQTLLDAYLHSAPDAAMPRELELFLNYLDVERNLSGSATFTAIVQAAKKHQIRVVAIDSEAIYSLGVAHTVADLNNLEDRRKRYRAMNMTMLDRYRQFDDGGKYIGFIGSGHVSTCLDVPGASELLNCPHIVIHDLDKSKEEHIEQDLLFGKEPETIRFDLLYHRHQNTKQPTSSVVPTSSPAADSVSQTLSTDSSASVPGSEVNAAPVGGSDALVTQRSEGGKKDIDNVKKLEIQRQFLDSLKELETKLNTLNNTSKCEGNRLHTILFEKQEQFFNELTSKTTEKELKAAIVDFRRTCREHVEIADKIMGHGWLYRIAEVLIKAVAALFAGIGMVLGSIVGQGLIKSEHRQKFAQTFFTLDQTEESQALDKFKKDILGDEKKDPGLLSDIKLK